MTLDEIETNIRTLAENKKIMVEQVGAARDLLAELLMSYETLCDLQAREYIRLHKAVKAAELENEKLAIAEGISNILEKSLVKEEQPTQKSVRCKHWDCGYCYAPPCTETNAINGGCFKPQECPANRG